MPRHIFHIPRPTLRITQRLLALVQHQLIRVLWHGQTFTAIFHALTRLAKYLIEYSYDKIGRHASAIRIKGLCRYKVSAVTPLFGARTAERGRVSF